MTEGDSTHMEKEGRRDDVTLYFPVPRICFANFMVLMLSIV